MSYRKILSKLPAFDNKKVVDNYMARLDTHGVSRRQFLSFASAGAAAAASAAAFGLPNFAMASPDGKLAFLTAYYKNEYNTIADKSFAAAAEAYGLPYAVFDGNFDSQLQLNQFEQQTVSGLSGAVFNLADGSSIRRLAQTASGTKIHIANVWGTLPWFTPFDADEYYALYAVPDEVAAHRAVSIELFKAIKAAKGGGKVAAVTGVPGHITDDARTRGTLLALKEFPEIELVGSLPGNWNREDSLAATENLLTRYKDLVGIIGQNDDEAVGIIAGLKAAGLVPGNDVFVSGADGTSLAARAIKDGQQVATSANSPAYIAALFTGRIYDVTHGWVPRASERLQYWKSVTTTKDNVDAYIARYVDNKVEPFDYRRVSKVLHPKDWDPQADITPLDIDKEWGAIPKPDGWQYPADYAAAKQNGEWDAVTKEYADHYKIKFDGPSPLAQG